MTYLVGKLPCKHRRAILISPNNLTDVVLVGGNDIRVGVEKIMVVGVFDVFDVQIHAAKVFPVAAGEVSGDVGRLSTADTRKRLLYLVRHMMNLTPWVSACWTA